MSIAIIILFIYLCLVISYYYMGGFLTPFSIFTIIMGISVLIALGSDFYIFSNQHELVLSLILTSLISFLCGFILIKSKKKLRVSLKYIPFYLPSMRVIILLFLLSFFGFLVFVWETHVQLGIVRVIEDPNLLNVAIASGNVNYSSWSQYLIKLSLINSIFILLKIVHESNSKKILIIFYILQILFTVSVRRSTLILVIVLNLIVALNYYIYIHGLNKKSYKKLFFALFSSIFIVYFIFSFFQAALNKLFETQGNLFGFPLSETMLTLVTYFSGSIVATGYYLQINYQDNFPIFGSTMRILYNFLNDFKVIIFDDRYLNLPFVSIPINYNTALAQFYIFAEGGYLNLILIYFLLGIVAGYFFYRMYNYKSSSALIVNSAISTFLIFSIREYGLIFIDYWMIFMSAIIFFLYEKKNQRRYR